MKTSASVHTGAAASVVPDNPDAPGTPFPRVADDAFDAELAAIDHVRTRSARWLVFGARLLSIIAALGLLFALKYDLRYAFSPTSPMELGAASTANFEGAAHRFVSVQGVPGGVGAVDYRRPLRASIYRLAPLVERPDVYVELKLPRGIDRSRFIPPTSLRGRLVPFDEAGARFRDGRSLIASTTGQLVPARAYLLEVGAEPSLRTPSVFLGLVAALVVLIQTALLALASRSPAQNQPQV